jgi:hypothetical protein
MQVYILCCYFNFCSEPIKLKNYRIFKKNIKSYEGVKIVCVEFNPYGNFELNDSDADILIQLKDGDIMWQKERLLNIGLEQINKVSSNGIVIMSDTDILFNSKTLIDTVKNAIPKFKVIQCFSKIFHLKKELCNEQLNIQQLDVKNGDNFTAEYNSCISAYNLYGNFSNGAAGYLWAFDLRTINAIKFYDKNILGSGDRICAAAFIGLPVPPEEICGISNSFYYEYLSKCKNLNINRNTVGFLNFSILKK